MTNFIKNVNLAFNKKYSVEFVLKNINITPEKKENKS
jgi:hypothetical protein